MTKQVKIQGRRIKLYSSDQGRTWASSEQSIVDYSQRKTMLRLELRQRFEHLDGMQDPDPNNVVEFEIPIKFI